MNYNSEIIILGANLSEGESLRTVCPLCQGGDSSEKSLSILRNDGLVWQCFRAKCGVSGGTRRATFSIDDKPLTKPPKPRKIWEGKTEELPVKVRAAIWTRWNISKPEYWYWTTDYGGRVCMSVRSPKDTHRGWVLRSLGTASNVKALTYTSEVGLSWYKTHPHAPTVVVEDIPSAIRASKYVNAVALLGTGIGLERAQEIADNARNGVIMALDQDAIGLSFRWARKYALLWGDVKVLPLKVDLKDMNEQELKEILNESRTTYSSKLNDVEGSV